MTNQQLNDLCKMKDYFINSNPSRYGSVYHYTSLETLRKIIKDDYLDWRLTAIEDFDDKHEARRTIEVYYDMALYELLSDRKIDKSTYDVISKIEVSKKDSFVIYCENEKPFLILAEQEVFVACFSKNKNDKNLFREYIKSTDKKGFCIEINEYFLNHMTEEWLPEFKFFYSDIIYANEVLGLIKEFILKLLRINIDNSVDFLLKYAEPIIRSNLSRLRCFIKLNRYSFENERRLIVTFPKSVKEMPGYQQPFKICVNNKKYIYYPFKKQMINGITESECVTKEELEEIKGLII